MVLDRKAYKVNFGRETTVGDVCSEDSKVVIAETAERAIEIAKDLLSAKEKKVYYVSEVEMLISKIDED